MGSVCNQKQNLRNYKKEKDHTKKTADGDQSATNMQESSTIFTTNPQQLRSYDCLILFTDRNKNLQRNQYLNRCQKSLSYHIKEFLKLSEIIDDDLEIGRFQFFDIKIVDIQTRRVALFCCEVWQGDLSVVQQITDGLIQLFDKLKDLQYNKIGITCLNDSYLGVPTNFSAKILGKVVLSQENNFKGIGIFCNCEQTKNLHSAVYNRLSKLSISSKNQNQESFYY